MPDKWLRINNAQVVVTRSTFHLKSKIGILEQVPGPASFRLGCETMMRVFVDAKTKKLVRFFRENIRPVSCHGGTAQFVSGDSGQTVIDG